MIIQKTKKSFEVCFNEWAEVVFIGFIYFTILVSAFVLLLGVWNTYGLLLLPALVFLGPPYICYLRANWKVKN